jgi:hypothetical protein
MGSDFSGFERAGVNEDSVSYLSYGILEALRLP